MQLSVELSPALNPFAAFMDCRAAVEAHGRLETALSAHSKRWSPLDKPVLPRRGQESLRAFDDAVESEDVPEDVIEACGDAPA